MNKASRAPFLEQEDEVTQVARGANQFLNLVDGENARQDARLRHFDDLNPTPIEFENVLPEELHANTVYFDSTPVVRINQRGKIDFQLFRSQSVKAAIEMPGDPAGGPGVNVDRVFAESLQLRGSQMSLIQSIELRFLVDSIVNSISSSPGIGQTMECDTDANLLLHGGFVQPRIDRGSLRRSRVG